ncbi:MAG: hypothetical protein JNM00_09775, partial [Flavobacteriales bacterium]|nr:hypothetical protein [Flavobacteriales bacterium]
QFANDNDMDMLYLSRHMFDESTGTAGVGYLVPMIPASSNILPEVYLQFNSYNLNARTTYAPWIGSGSFDEPLNLQPGCLSAYAGDCFEEVTGTSLPDNYETCFDAAFTDAMDFVGQHISTHWTSGGYIPLQAIMGSIFLKVTDCLSITPDGDMLRDFILAFNAKTQFLPVEMEDCETGFHADMPLIPADPHLPDPDEYRGECPPNFNFSAFMGGLNASNQDAFRNLCAIFASDPNTKEGPGTNNDTWLNAIRPLSYQLWFENVDTATAPASEVRLIDTLDLTVYDPQTFRATGFGVNDRMWSIPQNRMSHHEIVDLRPEVPVLVKVDVDFNETDGVIHVVYTALDTLTLQPEEDP